MLLKAFNEQKFLEELTGLDKLYDEGEAALEAVGWNDDEGEDDFFGHSHSRDDSSVPSRRSFVGVSDVTGRPRGQSESVVRFSS